MPDEQEGLSFLHEYYYTFQTLISTKCLAEFESERGTSI